MAEISGWSPVIAPEAINCQAPDTGNMETLELFATPEQREQWLEPLLAGEIRSAFAMTEPDVASSDATNITTRITRDGDDYVINGRKWWITGAADERCQVFIVMGKTDPDGRDPPPAVDDPGAPRHPGRDHRAEPADLRLQRPARPLRDRLPTTSGCRPATCSANEGDGFLISQARLGPGRIHHAMRAIGMAERALALMVDRAKSRVAFGQHLVGLRQRAGPDRPVPHRDRPGPAARLPRRLADRPVRRQGRPQRDRRRSRCPHRPWPPRSSTAPSRSSAGMGVSDDTPLAYFYAWARVLRIVDGPDAVHRRTVARMEMKKTPPYVG